MPTTTSALDPARSAALPGPDWLRSRRAAAAAALADAELPSSDEEVWRYSRIDDLDLDAYEPVPAAGAAASTVPSEAAHLLDRPLAGSVVVLDGHVARVELADRWSSRGVTLGPLSDHPDGDDVFGRALGEVSTGDLLEHVHDAFVVDPVALSVPAGVVVDEPFVVVDWSSASGALTCPHLVVRLGDDAEATLVEHHLGDEVDALTLPVTELSVGPAGRLRYLNVQDRGRSTWQIARQVSSVDRDGTLVAAQAALGGSYARTRADCRLVGRGATGNLVAVYYGDGDQTLDFRTFQDHAAPDTSSNLLFKGAVGGRARSVYTGLIRVRPEGRGTNALQTNRTIKLSDDAWAESVPNLEIENNDVRCSHASAVGPIDEEQRFYLESRGVPPVPAERLIVEGFFLDVLTQMPDAPTATAVWSTIAHRQAASS
jgi:Fe-S cluster assembly protein SufD